MTNGRTFTAATDELLVSLIERAREKIVFVAPGLTEPVAKALGKRLADEGRISVTVVVDADPEVYRLGFGTIEGLKRLKEDADKNLFDLRCQPGVRIGVLIADDTTLIYAPTPQLIEAGSTSQEKPNAIILKGSNAPAIARAVGAATDAVPTEAEVGQGALLPQQLKEVEDELTRNPPKPYNLARQAHVFSSRLQYVEFEVKHYKFSRKEAKIPPDLMGLEGNVDLEDRWRNAIRVLDDASVTTTITWKALDGKASERKVNQNTLEKERKQIEKDLLFLVKGYGWVIFKEKQPQFETRIKNFQTNLDTYFDALSKQVADRLDHMGRGIAELLLPRLKTNPPVRYRRHTDHPTEQDILEMLQRDVGRALEEDAILKRPSIRCVFKDISYQSFASENFMTELRAALEAKIVPKSVVEQIFREWWAAPERK